ncbi:MAG TPA: hypothetical protein VLL75_14495 [Vicinamibacteria bacterium]|nr:hypothetical protein [Vicinamibacteria bacterium]
MRSFVSSLGLTAVALLVVLHASILWDRVVQGRLSDPGVALRWLMAAALTVALLALRRRGVSLFWGRRALVFWLLVLLLHAGASVPQDPGERLAPEQLLFVVPAAVAPVWLLLVLFVWLACRALAGPAVSLARARRDAVPALRRGSLVALAPRAPPA